MPAYRVRTVFTGLPGSPYLSTLYFHTGSIANAQAAVTAADAFWEAVDGQLSSGLAWTTEPEVVEFLNPLTVSGFHATTPATGVGSGVGHHLPTANQILMRLRTNVLSGNRRVLGKVFIPGPTEEVSDAAGEFPAGSRAVVAGAGAGLINAGLQVASRKLNTFVNVASVDVWEQFAVLRSRRD